MISPLHPNRFEDADPLDSHLGRVQPPQNIDGSRWMRRGRVALGLSATPRPGLILLPLGVAIGPFGLSLLSEPVLSYLDPLVSVMLAALGVVVGLGLPLRRPHEGLLLAATSVEAGVTILLVSAGIVLAQTLELSPFSIPWVVAIMLGICASASSTTTSDAEPALVMRLGSLNDLLPIIVGGLALAFIRETSAAGTAWVTLALVAIAAAVALGGWLLISQTSAESEQHVFVAGSLLLLGGAAAYLSLSALFAGLVGGMVWNAAGGPACNRIIRDMRYLQRPLVVLLLLVAGARLGFSAETLTISVVYLLCRTVGKLGGASLLRLILKRHRARELGFSLMPPAVTGIAFAVNVLQVEDTWGGALLAIAAIGSLASEAFSLVIGPREVPS
jgi:hypothetical protein